MDQKYFITPFALSGDVTVIPNPVQGDGTVSFTQGYTFDYQRDQTTDPLAKNVDRQPLNWLLLQITTALQQYQQHAVPEWISPTNNGGVAYQYSKHAVVRYSATTPGVTFEQYVSISDFNDTVPGTDPAWQVVADQIATQAEVVAKANGRLIVTPFGLATSLYGRFMGRQYFAGSGSSVTTPPTGALLAVYDVTGGGGGGGGAAGTVANQIAAGSGGGAGGRAVLAVANPIARNITVGALGAGGSGATGGTTGGTSSVTGIGLSASGGNGGTAGGAGVSGAGAGAIGGIGTGGDMNLQGGNGYGPFGTNNVVLSGAGGNSFYGQGAPSVATYSTGAVGVGPGGGGGGGACPPSNAGGASGGNGAAGLIIVDYYG